MRTAIVVGAITAICALILLAGAGDPQGPNAYVIIGIATGAVYGLLAIGLVLVYKGSRVFNFAQGEFGTIAAFIVFILIEQVRSVDIPYGVAIAVAIAGVVVIGLIMERLVVRPLMNRPRIQLLVATIAFALFAIGMQIMLFLPEGKVLAPIIPTLNSAGDPNGINFLNTGYILSWQNLLVIFVLVGLAVILGYFFTRTDLGLAVLATSQDDFATRVVGVGVERVSRFIWGAAAFLGAVAGILYVPIGGALAPGVLTSQLLIPGFTAAVIGGMTSLPGAFVGGITVGLIKGMADYLASNYAPFGETLANQLPGFSNVALFVALLLVLLIRPQGLLGSEA